MLAEGFQALASDLRTSTSITNCHLTNGMQPILHYCLTNGSQSFIIVRPMAANLAMLSDQWQPILHYCPTNGRWYSIFSSTNDTQGKRKDAYTCDETIAGATLDLDQGVIAAKTLVFSCDTAPLKMCVYPHTNTYLNVPPDINFPLHLADLGFVSKWTWGPISRLRLVLSSYTVHTDFLPICFRMIDQTHVVDLAEWSHVMI